MILYQLSIKLAGAMIYLGKKSKSIKEGELIAKQKIENGEAFKKFLEIVELQGGNVNYIINPDKYPKSRFVKKVRSTKNGFVKRDEYLSDWNGIAGIGCWQKNKRRHY